MWLVHDPWQYDRLCCAECPDLLSSGKRWWHSSQALLMQLVRQHNEEYKFQMVIKYNSMLERENEGKLCEHNCYKLTVRWMLQNWAFHGVQIVMNFQGNWTLFIVLYKLIPISNLLTHKRSYFTESFVWNMYSSTVLAFTTFIIHTLLGSNPVFLNSISILVYAHTIFRAFESVSLVRLVCCRICERSTWDRIGHLSTYLDIY